MVLRFLRQCLLLSLPIVAALAGWLWLVRDDLPAPKVTNNVALNEQLEAFRSRDPRQLDVLAIGSSIALNNLSSQGVMEHFGPVAYRNMGAWGMDLGHIADLLPALVERSRPRTVLLPCNLMDFERRDHVLQMDSASVVKALDRRREWTGYLGHWDAPWYLRQTRLQHIRRNDPGNYEYLGFDAHGGAPLQVPPERVDPARHELRPPAADDLDPALYLRLERLAQELHERDVVLYVMAAPFREGVMDEEARRTMEAHVARLREAVEPHGHQVLDATRQDWPDELFCDSSHLNGDGALVLTRHLLRPLRTLARR